MTRRQRLILGALVGLLVGAFIVGGIMVVTSMYGVTTAIRETQIDNQQRAEQTNRAARAAETATDRIEECTTPGRDCYERGQQQTATAVADINRVAVYAAACADRPKQQTVEQIQACVIARLAKRP